MVMKSQSGPLARAIDQQSAEWLEATYPAIYDALERELAAGKNLTEIRRILRRKFGNEIREALGARILQAAEYLKSEDLAAQ